MTPLPIETLARPRRPRLFSLDGRLGRVDYIARGLGAVAAVFAVMLVASVVLPLAGALGRLLYSLGGMALLYGFLPLRFAQLTVRRAHDFNVGGWLALLLMVPIANLAFWVIPGSRRENRYGPPPEKASALTVLLAALLFLLLIGGFLMGSDRAPEVDRLPHSTTTLRPYTP